ncbi:MAG: hypothetical protein JWQ38_3274 [Flavipsychrobacter sp.]|nr:hypothetical protein [Flavipsychrobacter sp.]
MSELKSIQIHIPEPCNQNWDAMTLNGNGRHCAHCQQTVIDFTEWSDTALYNFLYKNKENTCGRFLSTQVDRPIYDPHQPHSRLYRLTLALGLTLLFTQTPSLLAQGRSPRIEQKNQQKPTDPNCKPYGVFKGRVLDDKKEPVVTAVIHLFQNGVIKGSEITDYDGNFKIGRLEEGTYDVSVLYIGYDSITLSGLVIHSGSVTTQDYQMKKALKELKPYIKQGGYRHPLVDRDPLDKQTKLNKHNLVPGELIVCPPSKVMEFDPPGVRIFTRDEIDHLPR